jgi:hypothetical protein
MVDNLPRNNRYTIGQEILNLCWNCIDLIFVVNAAENSEKSKHIRELSLKFDQLKLRLRLLPELNTIKIAQLTHIYNNYLYPIGAQIGAWQKWAVSK